MAQPDAIEAAGMGLTSCAGKSRPCWRLRALAALAAMLAISPAAAEESTWEAPPVGITVSNYVHINCADRADAEQFLDFAAEDYQTAVDYLVQQQERGKCVASNLPFMRISDEPIRTVKDSDGDTWRMYTGMAQFPGMPFMVSGMLLLVEIRPGQDA